MRFAPKAGNVCYALAAAVLMAVFVLAPANSPAEQADAKDEYLKVQEELKRKKQELNSTSREEKLAFDDLEGINRRLLELKRALNDCKARLNRTRAEADRLNSEISVLELRIGGRKDLLGRKLRMIYRYGRMGDIGNTLLLVGSSREVPQALRRLRYLEYLAADERRIIKELKDDLVALNERKSEIRAVEQRLSDEEAQVLKSEEGLSLEVRKKKRILASIRHRKAENQRVIKELESSSRRLLKLVRESHSSSADFEGEDFRKLKGDLPWPVAGRVAIPYGSQKDPLFKTPVFRNGIYISAVEGALVRAAHEGKVVYADWFKGYGQVVIVNHGKGYHTLYANLSEIFLKTGDIIKGRTEVGKVGSSGLIEEPSLYFEVRYKGKPLNPTQWLQKK